MRGSAVEAGNPSGSLVVAGLGTFDGVHRAHRAMLSELRRVANDKDAEVGLLLNATRAHRRRILGEPLRALIERGKAGGEFTSAQSTEWCVRAFGALLLAGARAVADGALTHDEAPGVVFGSLYEGLRA